MMEQLAYLEAIQKLQLSYKKQLFQKQRGSYYKSHMLDLCVGGNFATKRVASATVILNKIYLFFSSGKTNSVLKSITSKYNLNQKFILFFKTHQIQNF